MDLDSFAPQVDIQAEMGPEPEVRIDAVEPPAETTPETAVETTVDTPAETPETTPEPEAKVVPIKALHEARQKANEMRQQLAEAEKRNAEQIAALNAKLERLVNPPPPEPSFDENPAENLRQRQERLEAEQRAWAQERERIANETKAQTEQRQVIGYISQEVTKAEAEFSAKQPDYMDAVNYLRSVSEKNLRAQGMTDATQIAQITHQQSLNMAAHAIQQGLNPAEVAYTFAKNYGYQHKVDATKQVKAMAEAQGRTQTLGNGKPDTAFSLAALAQMDDEQLAEAVSDNKLWAKIAKSG